MGYLWGKAGDGLMWLLAWIHDLTNSWGIAIIGVTLLVRLAMHPLTKKQMNSMKKMQELQPRMKILQEKYADDRETQNKKVMELYKEHKVSPAAGCLPLLIQLPIFILLYNVLTRHGFPNATFLTVRLDGSLLTTIADAINLVMPSPDGLSQMVPVPKEQLGIVMIVFSALSNPSLLFANIGMWLPNTILLVVISFLTWLQQHLTAGGNPQMAMMNWFMPIFMTVICFSLPGGVLLYWGVSSLMGVLPQIMLKRRTSVEMKKKPVLLQEKPAHKEAE